MAFKSSIELNPDYARAYIGLAGVYFKRAQNQVRDSSSESGDQTQGEGQYQSAEQNLAQAVAFYQQVLDSASGSKGYGIPITAVARLGLGNTYRLQGEVLQRRGDLDQAREYFQRAIETLEPAVQPLAQASQERYLTQAYEYLGASFQWLALNYEGSQDFSRMLEAYHQADDYYQQCISQGESSADLIIKDDIVAKNCRPDGRQVRDVIENYTGGQG
jgi:tetratricopeptide (TPR) repeat protein